jgi:hypothetical protein
MIGNKFLGFYVRTVRPITSKIIYNTWKVFTEKNPQVTDFSVSRESFYLNIIKKYPYKSDPGYGFFDFTIEKPEDYYRNSKTGRDCDDYHRMWFWWCQHNYIEAYRVIVTPWNLTQAHAITIGRKDMNTWTLFDYGTYDYTIGKNENPITKGVSIEKNLRYKKYPKLYQTIEESWKKGKK